MANVDSTSETSTKRLPDFFNESLIQRILKEKLGNRVRIDSFTGTLATKPGDNYSSDVFSVTVHYNGRKEPVRLLAKIAVDDGLVKEFADRLGLFDKEEYTFRHLLPKLSAQVSQFRIEPVLFGARCYYAAKKPAETIVFDDLKALGYRLPDRTKGGLDFEHCALVMEKIGLFHAASMVFACERSKNLKLFTDRYAHGLVRASDDVQRNPALRMFQSGLEKFLEVAQDWPELNRTILDKLKALQPVYTQRIIECYTAEDPNPDGFKVLNHGDLWSSNMMFRYDTGDSNDAREVMFVDYQLSNYASPGLDLAYFLFTSARQDVRDHRIPELSYRYHRSLLDGLTIQYNGVYLPTYDAVQRQFGRYEFIGLVSALSMLPVILMDRTEDVKLTFDSYFDKDHTERIRHIQYTGAKYRKSVIPLLERFDAKGKLDWYLLQCV
uniref:CHK domain-containing protein n=1 Tax=Anopheles albimanus TaxID=7167 RepID=A0A3F2YQ50_ANOAL